MLRAIWGAGVIDYQLIDVPIATLQRIGECEALPVGTRAGRRSLGCDVFDGDELLFRLHFDGADGKCQVRNLKVDTCITLDSWQQKIAE